MNPLVANAVMASFKESAHPRDEDGKFTGGSSGASAGASEAIP